MVRFLWKPLWKKALPPIFLTGALFFFWTEFPKYSEYRSEILNVSPWADDPIEISIGSEWITEPFNASESLETLLVGPDPKIKTRLLELVSAASGSVDVSVYLLSDADVTDALVSVANRGVSVRVILERDVYLIPNANKKMKDRLSAAGIPVVAARDDPFAFTHAKYLLADRSGYVISTGNYAKTSFSKNREFFIFGNDPETSKFLSSVFEADFHGLPFVGTVPDRLYLAPIDARKKIVSLLSDAKRSIRILSPSLSDPEILSLLSKKADNGTEVTVCGRSDASDGRNEGGESVSPKVEVRKSSGPPLHAKAILVDGSKLLVGSANFTKNSIDRNREVGFLRTGSGDIRTYENTLEADCK